MAASLESQLNGKPYDRSARPSLRALLQTSEVDVQSTFSEREEALLRMLRTIASLLDRMQDEVVLEPLYATKE